MTDGSGVDISVEYAGSRDALILSASICKAKVRSQLVLGSSYSNETPFVIAPSILKQVLQSLVPAYHTPQKTRKKIWREHFWAIQNSIFPFRKTTFSRFKFFEKASSISEKLNL